MISNQVLQNTIEGLKEISRTDFCIIDTDGKMLASTFSDPVAPADIQAFVDSQADSQLIKGFQYFKVCDDYQLEYVLLVHGESEDAYMVGKLAAFQLQSLIIAYKERFDKDSFIKNLLLDNLLLVDIYNRAKKLHIQTDVRRVVMILELQQERDQSSIETIKAIRCGSVGSTVPLQGGKSVSISITKIRFFSEMIVMIFDTLLFLFHNAIGLKTQISGYRRNLFLMSRYRPKLIGNLFEILPEVNIFAENGV